MRKVELAVQILGAALVIWFFHWTVESSGGFNPPGDEDYYNFLVRGWRAGHLHMEKPPHEGMARLADPYDPVQNRDYRLADATYFNGRYYLYFSAVPALLSLDYHQRLLQRLRPEYWTQIADGFSWVTRILQK